MLDNRCTATEREDARSCDVEDEVRTSTGHVDADGMPQTL